VRDFGRQTYDMKTRRELVIVITVGVGHTSSPASPLPGGVGRVSASARFCSSAGSRLNHTVTEHKDNVMKPCKKESKLASATVERYLHRMLTSVLSLNVDAVELLASGAHKMHYS